MSLIKEEDITALRERANIVEVISSYVTLKKAGRSYKGLCPFHKEKTPSFMVDPEKQLFHCFGCDEGGNIFNFLMKVERLDFATAVENLANRIGYKLTYLSSPEAKKKRRQKDSLEEINKQAVDFYHNILMKSPKGEAARSYLKNRGYGQKTASFFKLGYAPSDNSLYKQFLKNGFTVRQLLEAGLIIQGREGHIDRFRHRIIFPIADVSQKWIGLGGRVLNPDQQPKYMNSPETPLFSKGKNFYGLNWSKSTISSKGYSVIVEGYTDVISLYKAGFKNCVATLGTALTEDHLSLLSRFAAKAYLTFDSDEAGAKAAERVIEFYDKQATDLFICILPQGEDPADYVSKHKAHDFQALIKKSKPIMEFCIERIVAKNGTSTTRSKEKTLKESFDLIARVKNKISRSDYIKYLAERINADLNEVTSEFNQFIKTRKSQTSHKQKQPSPLSPLERVEVELLKTLLNNPNLADTAKSVVSAEDFSNENFGSVFSLLTSSKLEPSQIVGAIENEEARRITSKLLMSPVVTTQDGKKYILEVCAKLKELKLGNRIRELKGELEKLNPLKFPKKYDNLFKELVELESQKRECRRFYQGG